MGVGGPRAVRESFQNLKETGKAMILARNWEGDDLGANRNCETL
jgi:hypothetical protein